MFKDGDIIRVISERELTRRYAEKNKLPTEIAKRKIHDYCNYSSNRGLVVKKHEKPFRSLTVCGARGRIVRIHKESDKIVSYTVSVKVKQSRWGGYNEEPTIYFIDKNFSIPPSCLMYPDFQMEFDFFE